MGAGDEVEGGEEDILGRARGGKRVEKGKECKWVEVEVEEG